jgi:hypothetical protein
MSASKTPSRIGRIKRPSDMRTIEITPGTVGFNRVFTVL